MKYKGYSIGRNYKTIYHYEKRSGHWWSEDIPKKGFYIIGLGVFSDEYFGTIEKAKKHIDFLIENNHNKTYFHVTRKTHPQYYKKVI